MMVRFQYRGDQTPLLAILIGEVGFQPLAGFIIIITFQANESLSPRWEEDLQLSSALNMNYLGLSMDETGTPQIDGYFIGEIATLVFFTYFFWSFPTNHQTLVFSALNVQTATLLHQRCQAHHRCATLT